MFRAITAVAAVAAMLACRPYDRFSNVADESGLVPAEQYARYGVEQAQAVAIGRALGQWHGGSSPEARAIQATRATEYARTLPGVAHVTADTLGYRLTVTFKSGWRTAVVPITDGVRPEDTPGLPGAKQD